MVNSTTLRNGSKSRRYNLRSIARVDYSQIRKTVKKSSPPKKEDKGAISVNREIKTEPGIELPSTSKSSLVFHENGSVKRKVGPLINRHG
jgi:hypothetical protein